MKNNSTGFVLAILAFAMTAAGNAAAAPDGNNPGLPGQVQRNAADIADNFSQIQANRADIMDLDERVSGLEAGGGSPGGERSFVDVDCTADPDALMVDKDTSIYFPPNTTYNIQGACNGPLYVTEDGVRFVGTGDSPAIVLPADTANAANGAVFADGASDVRVQNLLIDASAWGTPAAEGSDAAGVYARHAFVRVIDTRIVGALWSINPFRNAIVRLQGLVELEDFVNAGLSVGDQSLVSGRGPVVIASSITGSSYLVGIEAYRSGLVDMRSGVSVDLPAEDPTINLFPNSITSTDQSLVRIRSGGLVDLQGNVFLGRLGSLRIEGGDLSGNIFARDNSSLLLRNMAMIGGEISLESNSSANLSNVQAGMLSARSNSSAQVFQGTLTGANLDQGATAVFIGPNLFGDVALFSATYLDFFSNGTGGLNGNTIYKCGEFVVANADALDLGGNVVLGCPIFP